MATETYYFRGKAKWAKVYRPDPEYDNYKINVYLDKPSKELFEAAGTQLTPKSDDDGEYVTFRRDHSKMIKKDLVTFGPPRVVDHDNNPLTETIGNGSEVVVKVQIYDGTGSKPFRWSTSWSTRVATAPVGTPQKVSKLSNGRPRS
jgi:hypothetical protein